MQLLVCPPVRPSVQCQYCV